jgi:hypothetical protein
MKKIIWRLKESPTTEKLSILVKEGILTKDEAREILFSSETEEDRDKKSLESEIKFLREIVEKLSNDKSRIVEVIREVQKPYYYTTPWYGPYQNWCYGTTGTVNTLTGGATTTGVDLTRTCSVPNCVAGCNDINFSDIKTF